MRRNTLTNKYIPKGNTADKPTLEEGEVYFNTETSSFHIGTLSGTDQIFSDSPFYELIGRLRINEGAGATLSILHNTFPFSFTVAKPNIGYYTINAVNPDWHWGWWGDYLNCSVSGDAYNDDGNNLRLFTIKAEENTDIHIYTHDNAGNLANFAGFTGNNVYFRASLLKQYLFYDE
jgi:hypothetical protein